MNKNNVLKARLEGKEVYLVHEPKVLAVVSESGLDGLSFAGRESGD